MYNSFRSLRAVRLIWTYSYTVHTAMQCRAAAPETHRCSSSPAWAHKFRRQTWTRPDALSTPPASMTKKVDWLGTNSGEKRTVENLVLADQLLLVATTHTQKTRFGLRIAAWFDSWFKISGLGVRGWSRRAIRLPPHLGRWSYYAVGLLP
jgi:hypothetical protein